MTQYTRRELERMYDDFLDEVVETVKIGSLEYLPSRVLKAVDPIAYRCGLNDWADSENYEEKEES
jgi:hypothetical protein